MKSLIKLQLAVATVLLSTASFASAATASSLDGEWQGTFQCSPSPTDPVKVPAYNSSFILTVMGDEASGSRVAPKVTEVLKGVIDADGTLKLTGIGQLKSGEGKPWTTTISGSFNADLFTGKGGMFDSKGNQARDCTVSLGHVGVTQSTVKKVDGDSSLGIPKYLELARELVATVKPENNRYNYVNHPTGVHWKDEPFRSENSVDTMCVGLVTDVLEKAESPFFKELKSKVHWRKRVWGRDFIEAMSKGYGLTEVKNIEDVAAGDIWIMRCSAEAHCTAQGATAQGHVAFIDVKPYKQAPLRPIVPGTTQWVVTVIDSAQGPIDLDDTRYKPFPTSNITGVGRGSFRIYTNDDGVQVGWAKSLPSSKFVPVKLAWVLFAHPKY